MPLLASGAGVGRGDVGAAVAELMMEELRDGKGNLRGSSECRSDDL